MTRRKKQRDQSEPFEVHTPYSNTGGSSASQGPGQSTGASGWGDDFPDLTPAGPSQQVGGAARGSRGGVTQYHGVPQALLTQSGPSQQVGGAAGGSRGGVAQYHGGPQARSAAPTGGYHGNRQLQSGPPANVSSNRMDNLSPREQQLNEVAMNHIIAMQKAGEFVDSKKIIDRLLETADCQSVNKLPLRRRLDNLPCLKKLSHTLRKVNLFIEGYMFERSVTTVNDLYRLLVDYMAVESYEELGIGPFTKHPLVYTFFKVPTTQDISKFPDISAADLAFKMNVFLRKHRSQNNLDFEEFMKFLMDSYNITDAWSLGIKIGSFPLLIQTASRIRRQEFGKMDAIRMKCSKLLEDAIYEEFGKLEAYIIDMAGRNSSGVVTKRRYLQMKASDVVKDLFDRCYLELFEIDYGQRSGRRQDPRHKERYVWTKIGEFLEYLGRDRLASKLFQFALVSSKIENIPPPIHTPTANLDSSMTRDTRTKDGKQSTSVTSDEVFAQCKASMKDMSGMSLSDLEALERKVTTSLNLRNFTEAGQGSFLGFLKKNMTRFSEDGFNLSGAGGAGSAAVNSNDLYLFLKQLKVTGSTDESQSKALELAVEQQFLCKFNDTGFSTGTQLLKSFSRTLTSSAMGRGSSVFTFDLGCKELSDFEVESESHGESPEVWTKLLQVPLLEDVARWTHWNNVFFSQYGPLKPFIEREAKTKRKGKYYDKAFDYKCLVTNDGHLLRLPSESPTIESICGHLNSMATREFVAGLVAMATEKGIAHAPWKFLREKLRKSIEDIIGKHGEQAAIEWVLSCFHMLPANLLTPIVKEVFLDPLHDQFSSAVHEKLLRFETGDAHVLKSLGISLCVSEWAQLGDEIVKQDSQEEDSDEFLSEEEQIAEPQTAEEITTESKEPDRVDLDKIRPAADTTAAAVRPKQSLVDHGDSCKAVVDVIRKGYGFNQDGKIEGEIAEVLRGQLGNSLERLSKELYNSNTHFVLELIQNADDNTYLPDTLPSLVFVVEENQIRLYNNEVGFNQEQIKAISAVGKSTKGKHVVGYIGQKGIGFKSVFTVTDCPEIHSNGYHIRFDKEQDAIGYILPTWVDDVEEKPSVGAQGINLKDKCWTTDIHLPLKLDTDEDRSRSNKLTGRFQDIKPQLLLFLNRLKRVTVENKVLRKTTQIQRKDVSDKVVDIKSGHKEERWFVSKRKLKVPNLINNKVESTELALGFPISKSTQGYKKYLKSLKEKPKMQELFAFLPLREFGFNFVIQGDFEIPSSRQDVRQDSEWNEWLREEIAPLFVESWRSFKEVTGLGEIQALIYFLKFIPTPANVPGFFHSSAESIIKEMKKEKVAPVVISPNKIEWKSPSDTVVCPKEIREILPQDLLMKEFGKAYLHQDVAECVEKSVLDSLGVQPLEADDIVDILVKLCDSHQDKGTVMPMKDSAQWLACLYHPLQTHYDKDNLAHRLKSLPLVYTTAGKCVSLAEDGAIFFPEDSERTGDAGVDKTLKDVRSELRTVDRRFMLCQKDLANANLREMLELLGVKDAAPESIVDNHILPRFRQTISLVEPKYQQMFVPYLKYIFWYWTRPESNLDFDSLKEVVHIKMEGQQFKKLSDTDIFFSNSYGNPYDLTSFKGYKWNLISKEYLQHGAQANSNKDWRNFFEKLGVKDFIEIKAHHHSSKTRQELLTLQPGWDAFLSDTSEADGDGDDKYTVTDYSSDILQALLQSQHMGTCHCLFDEFSTNWSSKYRQLTEVLATTDDTGHRVRIPSSFLLMLKSYSWVPASVIQGSDTFSKKDEVQLKKASEVFVQNRHVHSLLYVHAHFVKSSGACTESFVNDLGLKHSLGVADLETYFEEWSSLKYFYTSINHIKSVYNYLWQEGAFDVFQNNRKSIFVPTEGFRSPSDLVGGIFVPLVETYWHDETQMFAKYRPKLYKADTGEEVTQKSIASLYQGMEQFFLGCLAVRKCPSVDEYCSLLEAITTHERNANVANEGLMDVAAVMQHLLERLHNADQRLVSSVIRELKPLKIWPTKKNVWVSSDDSPMLVDDEEIAEELSDEPMVFLISLDVFPDDKKRCIKEWMQQLGIKSITENIERKYIPVNLMPSVDIFDRLNTGLPLVQEFLKGKFPSLYQRKSAFFKAIFDEMMVFTVSELEVVYNLKSPIMTFVKKQDCYVDVDAKAFYVHKDKQNYWAAIFDEMATFILEGGFNEEVRSREVSSFMTCLERFLVDKYPDSLEKFWRKVQCSSHALIAIEQQWKLGHADRYVPKPAAPEPSELQYDESLNWNEEDELKLNANRAAATGLTSWPPMKPVGGVMSAPSQDGPKKELPDFALNPPLPPDADPDLLREAPGSMQSAPAGHRPTTGDVQTQNQVPDLVPQSQNKGQSLNPVPGGDKCVTGEGGAVSSTQVQTGSETSKGGNDGSKAAATGSAPSNGNNTTENKVESDHVTSPAVSGDDIQSQSQRNSPQKPALDNVRKVFTLSTSVEWTISDIPYLKDTGVSLESLQAALPDIGEDHSKRELAQWGETLVWRYLTVKYARENENVTVSLVNADGETGEPFDLVIKDANNAANSVKKFVEVKTTASESKHFFELSNNQLTFLKTHKENYSICRVYNGGTFDKVKLLFLENASDQLDKKKIKLFMSL